MTTFNNAQLTLEDIPSVSSVKFSDLHPKYRWINLPASLICFAFPIIPIFIVHQQAQHSASKYLVWILGCLFVLLCFYINFHRAKARRYALRKHDVLFQHGLFWQKTTAVAFNRIQHIDLTHGPLERKYAIATLKFFTAGGSSVDLKIPGLPEQDAQQIRALILSKINPEDTQSEINIEVERNGD